MVISYWLAAIVLGIFASGFIIGPLVVKPLFEKKRIQKDPHEQLDRVQEREQLNVRLYEERIAELSAQLEELEITAVDFAEMELELQKNLLVDTDEVGSETPVSEIGRLPLVFAALVPLFAIFAYSDIGLSWGAISDVEIAGELNSDGIHDPVRMKQTVEKLARSMEQQPDNHEGWFMLGQLYHRQAEYEKAAAVFKKLSLVFTGDSGIASYYAESLFLADNRVITSRVDVAIGKALALNPHELTMLEIRGMDAFQKGEYSAANQYFIAALAMAEGPRAKLIQQALERLETQTGVTGTANKTAPFASSAAMPTRPVSPKAETEPTGTRSLEVLVEVDSQVDVKTDSFVFVFAKAVTGPPMPLAVQKLLVADLPRLIKLDESMAMMEGMGLANFDLIEVVARISSSGIANASPDDYEARSGQIDITMPTSVVKLTIKNQIKSKLKNKPGG